MQKEFRTVDLARGIVCLTTTDERFYVKPVPNPLTGLPEMHYRPSVTWITDYYPKGYGFNQWLKKNGDEADQIARLAADRGYKVHRGIALLNEGEEVKMTDSMENPSTGQFEPLTPEEYAGLMSYVDWWETEGRNEYIIEKWEWTIWPNGEACAEKYKISSDMFNFAGTGDIKLRRKSDDKTVIVDCKTSLDVWPAHELQVSAYAKAEGADEAAILQLNYRRNKTKKWKFTPIADKFDVFCATKRIWQNETEGIKPLQRDYPLSLKLKMQ